MKKAIKENIRQGIKAELQNTYSYASTPTKNTPMDTYMAAFTKIKGLNRSTQNTGTLGRFVEFLTYKAELICKKVIRIDERYTSKTCCNCGLKHEMKLYNRRMICDCGNNIDRDQNSAINIMYRFLSTNGLWTAYQHFVGNLRQTVPSLDGTLVESPMR